MLQWKTTHSRIYGQCKFIIDEGKSHTVVCEERPGMMLGRESEHDHTTNKYFKELI